MGLSFNTAGRGYFDIRGHTPWTKEIAMPEVLRILLKHIKRDELEPAERRAVNALEDQLDGADRNAK